MHCMQIGPHTRTRIEYWFQRRLAMRALHNSGMSLAEIGRRYRITRQRVWQIVRR